MDLLNNEKKFCSMNIDETIVILSGIAVHQAGCHTWLSVLLHLALCIVGTAVPANQVDS